MPPDGLTEFLSPPPARDQALSQEPGFNPAEFVWSFLAAFVVFTLIDWWQMRRMK